MSSKSWLCVKAAKNASADFCMISGWIAMLYKIDEYFMKRSEFK
jgi:hypothetical protein